jgi:hypothetical protein
MPSKRTQRKSDIHVGLVRCVSPSEFVNPDFDGILAISDGQYRRVTSKRIDIQTLCAGTVSNQFTPHERDRRIDSLRPVWMPLLSPFSPLHFFMTTDAPCYRTSKSIAPTHQHDTISWRSVWYKPMEAEGRRSEANSFLYVDVVHQLQCASAPKRRPVIM